MANENKGSVGIRHTFKNQETSKPSSTRFLIANIANTQIDRTRFFLKMVKVTFLFFLGGGCYKLPTVDYDPTLFFFAA